MVPPALKNFFLLCGTDLLAHKPGLIVTVSAGTGGSYPVTELRTSSYKNTRLCYIPDHVIVRNVGHMLQGNQAADEHDAALRERIDYSLRVLVEYAKALRLVRESGVIDLKAFPYGM
jgi:NAD(P)H-dependent FMN reductase